MLRVASIWPMNLQEMPQGYTQQHVWGAPLRVWHWLLAVSVVSGWLIGEFRTFSIMQWHFYAGYCTGALLLVRVVMGFTGPRSVRFSALWPVPKTLFNDVKTMFHRRPSGNHGHSPLGGLATIAILLCLIWQVATGLMSIDDALFFEGPLASWVSSSTNRMATRFHHYGATAILVLFVMHISIMLFYKFWKHENLVIAMISGKKLVKKTIKG